MKILVYTITLFLFSCAKEYSFEAGEKFYLTCTIDDSPKVFVNAFAGHHTDPEYGFLSIIAPLDSTDTADYFWLSVVSNFYSVSRDNAPPVVVGNYSDKDTVYWLWAAMLVDTPVKKIAYAAGSEFTQLAEAAGITIEKHLVLLITEIKNRTVRGTFSGDFFEQGDPLRKVIKIRDGKFYLPMR